MSAVRNGAMLGVAVFVLTAFLRADAPAADQNLKESIVSAGKPRSYRAFVPDSFGKNGPAPAVVLFKRIRQPR